MSTFFKSYLPLLLLSLIVLHYQYLIVGASFHSDHEETSTKHHLMESEIGAHRSLLMMQPPMDCGASCKVRCSLSSRPRLCNRACGTCCQRCQCVPPGTAGNYEYCPCYAKLTTHGGRRKCP
ncbi:hypothetical protein Syun_005356 [Stephania yunnanensis]|uniref:Snakin-2 n=1 Tax=Stephania yunnanensis TaxID=152371 RepID=A0AAP0Q3D6_9MAGN